ncbi:PKD domain-containing protein [Gimesia panareensis]|uniref:PKD domain-containing protein n=1 Tax=Gimesia panareensis TaxID=2527978 RepID=UPI00118955E1|nr:PKD domain-containing protein [Gimesia panareensis]QDU49638.1 Poly(beta-D-mannuronate) C5 epimerase 5 [Gimesia panareensis]
MLLSGPKSWKKLVERSVKRSLYCHKELHRRRRNSTRFASSAAVEFLEDRTLLSGSSLAVGTEDLIENGDFETGNFTGWAITNTGSGSWYINNGSFDPPGPGTPLPPISGSFDAVSYPGGPGMHLLSENIIIPENITAATLSWSDRIRNYSSTFNDPNQEWRVQVQDTAGNLIQEVFSTNPGDPLQQIGPNHRSFDLTPLFQLLEGQSIRISFELEANQYFFNTTLDDVSLLVTTDNRPTVDLNGEDDPGIDYSAAFVEDGGPISIVDTDLTVSVASSAQPLPSGPIKVAVVGGGPSSDDSGFQAIVDQLNDDTYYDFTATLVQPTDIDTLGELEAYDTVVIGGSGQTGYDIGQFELFQTPLRAWAMAGGGVVMTGWGVRQAGSSTGAIHPDINAVVPVNTDAYSAGISSGTVQIDLYEVNGGQHPVTQGVNWFTLHPGDYIEYSTGGIDPGAGVLATTNNQATVVAGSVGAGRSVYLGPIYSGGSIYNNAELRTGDPDHLLENAVAWAGGNLTGSNSATHEDIYTTYGGGRVGTIDSVTGSLSDIGAMGTPQTFATAFDTDGSGTLYTLVDGWSGNAHLATINLTTGAATPVAGPGTGTNMISLEVAADGTMYGIGYNDRILYQIDKTTGAATAIGNTGIVGNMDLAFDSTGTLWATTGNHLWTIDTTTGASTFQTNITGISSGSVMGIMFDSSDRLLATRFTVDSPLYAIDTTTGTATIISTNTTFAFPHGGDILLTSSDVIDYGMIDSATVRITNPLDLIAESVFVNAAGTGLSAIYDYFSGTLTLTGTQTAEVYEQVLRTAKYNNGSQDPNTTDRIIEFSVTSGTETSQIATSVVSVTAVNDPPVINDTLPLLTKDNITEGQVTSLRGTFSDFDAGDTHTVEVNWGDGSPNSVLNLAAGVHFFYLSHIYSDDNPTGTAVDLYPVSVTVTDDSGASATAETSITVNNVAPRFNSLVSTATINENGTAYLTAYFADPGLNDTFTVVIDWNSSGNPGGPGGGTTTLTQSDLVNLGGGLWRASASHQYLDDNPTGSPQDIYSIGVTVTDDDGGVIATSIDGGIKTNTNLSPTIGDIVTSPTLATIHNANRISFYGPGGAHSYGGPVDIEMQVHNPGTGNWETVWSTTVPSGQSYYFNGVEFQFSPRDVDAVRLSSDSGQGNTFGSWNSGAVVTIKPEFTLSPTVTVKNVNPLAYVTGLHTVDEGTPVTLTGHFLDLGTQDTHTQTWTVIADNGQVIAPGTDSTFTFTPDDDGLYTVYYTVTDDDGGSTTREFKVTAENVAPELSQLAATREIYENDVATVSGVITDPGLNDTFTVAIDWNALGNVGGPGEGTTTLTQSDLTDLGNGQWRFTASHQYLDDNPTASSQDTYEIGITVIDDDGGTSSTGHIDDQAVTTNLSPAHANDLTSSFFPTVLNADRINFAGRGFAHSHPEAVDLELQVHNASTGAWETVWTSTIHPFGEVDFDNMEIDFSPRDVDAVRMNSNPGQDSTFHFWDSDTEVTIGTQAVSPTVLVKNWSPIAIVTGLHTVDEGTPVTLYGHFLDHGTLDTHTETWTVTADNGQVIAPGSGSNFTFTPDDNGLYTVAYTVTDDDGGNYTREFELTVENVAPELSYLNATSEIFENDTATVSGIINDPGTADTFTVVIDWNALGNVGGPGEGTTTLTQSDLTDLGNGQWQFTASHQYLDDNPTASSQDTYEIGITVNDDDGGAISSVHIDDQAVTTNLSPAHSNYVISSLLPTVPNADRITLAGQGIAHSHPDAVDLTLQVHNASTNLWETVWTSTIPPAGEVDFDGMEILFSPRDVNAVRILSNPGQNNTFHFWGSDTDVTIGTQAVSPTVLVKNWSPISNITGRHRVQEGTPVTLYGQFIDHGTLDTHTQTWTVTADNGQVIAPDSGSSFTFTPNENGLYTVAFTVTDDDGGSYTREFELTVDNVSPSVSDVVFSDVIDENGIATLSGVISDPGINDTFTVAIDWNALGNIGAPGEGTTILTQSDLTDLGNGQWAFSTTHQYLDDNPTASLQDTYEIDITVTDDDGGVGTLSGSLQQSVTTYLSPVHGEDLSSTTLTPILNAGKIGFAGPGIAHSHGSVAVDLELQVHNTGTGNWDTIWTSTIPPGGEIDFDGMEILFSPRDIDSVRLNSDPDQYNSFHFWGNTTAVTIESVPVPPPAVIVKNVDPVATISGLSTVDEGTLVTFNGSFTDQGTLDTHTESWTVTSDNGQVIAPGSGGSFSFTPDDNGIYTIAYTVTDDDGGSDTQEFELTVENVDPTLSDITVNDEIDENGLATLSGIINDPGTADTFALVIDWNTLGNVGGTSEGTTTLTQSDLTYLGNGQWNFSTTHQYLDDNPTASLQDTYGIGLTVTDDDSGSGTGSAAVQVNNLAPVITGLLVDSLSINENDSITVSGSFTDVGTLDTHEVEILWGDGTTSLADVDTLTRIFTASHQYLDDGPSPGNGTASDEMLIGVRITDDDGGVAEDLEAATVTVSNIDPQITELSNSSPDCGGAVEDETVSLSGSFTDVGTLDLHSATIDWGDGTLSAATLDETGGSGTFGGSHAYTAGGIYTVTVNLSDDDTGSDTLTTTVIVTGVGLQEIDGQTVLQIIGTDQNDHVTINQQGNGLIKVHADFLPEQNGFRTFESSEIDLLFMSLCEGDDDASVAGNIDIPSIINGGGGNDHLNGGAGSNVILGGAGDDTIIGGTGRDILIGGTGSDRIVGGPGQDIITGNATVYESDSAADLLANTAALLAIQEEWNADTPQAERQANLSDDGAANTRLNDDFFIRLGQDIIDDEEEDQLTGSSDEDWFLLSVGDTQTGSSLQSSSNGGATTSASSSSSGNGKGKK